ncbi:MAG: DMT family transporter [Pseudomonadota bacterium]
MKTNAPARQAAPHKVGLGISLIVSTMFVTSIQDVVFKLFSADMTLWQIFTLRGVLAAPLLVLVARWQGIHNGIFQAALQPWVLLRAACMTLLFLAFYGAIPFISLSTVGAANYVAPIFVAVLSACMIKERVGWRGAIAVIVGFAGVITLLQPGTDAFSPWALLPLAGAGFYAFAHIITRTRCQHVPLAAMALSVTLCMMAAGAVISLLVFVVNPAGPFAASHPYLFGAWTPMGQPEWMVLALLAVLSVIITMGLAASYKAAPPPTIATFEYCYLIFVTAWDLLIFALAPSLATIAGMLLIVGAGLLVLRR